MNKIPRSTMETSRPRLPSMEPDPFLEYRRSPSASPAPYGYAHSRKHNSYSSPNRTSTALPSPDSTPAPPNFQLLSEESLPTPPEEYPSKPMQRPGYSWTRQRTTSLSSLSSVRSISTPRSRSVSISVESNARSTPPPPHPPLSRHPSADMSSTRPSRKLPTLMEALETSEQTQPKILQPRHKDPEWLASHKAVMDKWPIKRPLQRGNWLNWTPGGPCYDQTVQYLVERPDEYHRLTKEAYARPQSVERAELEAYRISERQLITEAPKHLEALRKMSVGPRPELPKLPRIARPSHLVFPPGHELYRPQRSQRSERPERSERSERSERPEAPVRAPSAKSRGTKRSHPDASSDINPVPTKNPRKRSPATEKEKFNRWQELCHYFAIIPEVTDQVENSVPYNIVFTGFKDANRGGAIAGPKKKIPQDDAYRHLMSRLEIDLAEKLAWDSNKFLIHKLRLFKLRFEEYRDNPGRTFNKTRAQHSGQCDVNMMSRFYEVYNALKIIDNKFTCASAEKSSANQFKDDVAKQDLEEIGRKLANPQTAQAELERLRTAYRGQNVGETPSTPITTVVINGKNEELASSPTAPPSSLQSEPEAMEVDASSPAMSPSSIASPITPSPILETTEIAENTKSIDSQLMEASVVESIEQESTSAHKHTVAGST